MNPKINSNNLNQLRRIVSTYYDSKREENIVKCFEQNYDLNNTILEITDLESNKISEGNSKTICKYIIMYCLKNKIHTSSSIVSLIVKLMEIIPGEYNVISILILFILSNKLQCNFTNQVYLSGKLEQFITYENLLLEYIEECIAKTKTLLIIKKIYTYSEIVHIINNFQDEYKTDIILKIYLFGSYAKNKQSIYSDIDLMIVTKNTYYSMPNYKYIEDTLINFFEVPLDIIFVKQHLERKYIKKFSPVIRIS